MIKRIKELSIGTIKELSIGTQRLVFFGSFVIALLVQYIYEPSEFFDLDGEDFWIPLILGWIGYWVLLRIILWIIDGYKKNGK